ncbi:MAG: hypothetical protein WAT74_11300 [Flavobacteriales bacterium]
MRALLLLTLIPLFARAQHCAFDYYSIIVVRPHAIGDSAVIDGLRISLLDTAGLPFGEHGPEGYLFKRNGLPVCSQAPRKERDKEHFPFAGDSYVLVVPARVLYEGSRLLVQDERDDRLLNKRKDEWPVRYRQQVLSITNNDVYPLCGTYDEGVYPPMEGRPNFAPVDIILYPR